MFFDLNKPVRKLFLIPLLFAHGLRAQHYFQDHFGASVSIIANVGSHVSGIGIGVNTYYTDYFYQFNLGSTFYLNEHSYGGRRNYFDWKTAVGAALLFGRKEMPIDFQLNGLNHQTAHNFAVAYNYILYRDNAGTSQSSGGFALHLKNFSLYHENDVFAGNAKDRFRTGHVLLTYREEFYKLGFGVNLWTGETANSIWQRVSLDECPSGFRLLEELPYGKTAHGIAYGGIWYQGPYNQIAHLKIGYDSEQIRHIVQNRIIHDLVFLPKGLPRNTPHYPRIDENGCAVFTKDEIRKGKMFLQLGMNDQWAN